MPSRKSCPTWSTSGWDTNPRHFYWISGERRVLLLWGSIFDISNGEPRSYEEFPNYIIMVKKMWKRSLCFSNPISFSQITASYCQMYCSNHWFLVSCDPQKDRVHWNLTQNGFVNSAISTFCLGRIARMQNRETHDEHPNLMGQILKAETAKAPRGAAKQLFLGALWEMPGIVLGALALWKSPAEDRPRWFFSGSLQCLWFQNQKAKRYGKP